MNRVNREELKERMRNSKEPRTTISFYKYCNIAAPKDFRNTLFADLSGLGVLGRIYVAKEGINAQISVLSENFETLKNYLYSYEAFDKLRLNVAVEDDGRSFFTLTIKVRKKIVADGLDDDSFDPSDTGRYLTAEEFNALTDEEQTVLIDMRNAYESEVGHFEGAVCPDVLTFREQLPLVVDMLEEDKEKPVVMYCTGGIRCEKASAFLKHKGFKNVFHLKGGIIKYAHDVQEKGLKNKFIGKNFVFDERLGERISDEIIAKCHQCGASADTHINCGNKHCHLLFIQCEKCAEKYEACCSNTCKDFKELSAEEQKEKAKTMTFNGTNFGKSAYKIFRKNATLDD